MHTSNEYASINLKLVSTNVYSAQLTRTIILNTN